MKFYSSILGYFIVLLFLSHNCFAWNYPDESGYSDIPTVGTTDLYTVFQAKQGLIIDVRSGIEYQTAHINSSVHIPLSDRKFIERVKEEAAKKPDQPIYFYCNGGTCLKAPAATKKATEAGLKNCFSYYEGLPGWADKHPDQTMLRGEPVSASNKLIPKSEFNKTVVAFDDFKKLAETDANVVVVDVRDPIQKSGDLPLTQKVLSIPLDKFIPNIVEKKRYQDKTLLIFDQVGKQVQSLQYDLVANGYSNYKFLKKGATSVLGKQTYR